jgi:hypothetical protein
MVKVENKRLCADSLKCTHPNPCKNSVVLQGLSYLKQFCKKKNTPSVFSLLEETVLKK